LISGVLKAEPWRAISRSQDRAVERAKRRFAEPRHQPKELQEQVGGEVLFDQRGVGAEAAEVGTGAEHLLAGPSQHHRPHLFGIARRPHRVDQLSEHPARQHVPLLGVVEGHGGNAIGDLVEDQLVVGHRRPR
jgi:hypothetical protein